MGRTLKVVAGLAIVLAMVPVLRVAAAGGQIQPVLVKTTIANTMNGSPLRIQSDGAAYETTVVGAKMTVESKIYYGADFFLTTYYNSKGVVFAKSGRTALVDLSEVASPGFTTPTTGQVPVQLGVKCRLAAVAVNMLTMKAGDFVECPGSLRFWAPDGQWYRLSFSPSNFSTSDQWSVRCDASGGAGCTVWTITPSTFQTTGSDPNPKSRNTLLRINANGDILEVGGDYYLSFHITLTR